MSVDKNPNEDRLLCRFPFIEGSRVSLQPHIKDSIPDTIVWMNEPGVRHYLRHAFPITAESEKKWLEESAEFTQKTGHVQFTIILNATKKKIGDVGLNNISWTSKHCWLGLAIGDKEQWGKEYAKEAAELVLEYAFGELNLHKVMVGIFAKNKNSLAVARKIGFELAGIGKDEIFVDGEYVDTHYLEMVRDRWIVLKHPDLQ